MWCIFKRILNIEGNLILLSVKHMYVTLFINILKKNDNTSSKKTIQTHLLCVIHIDFI